MSEEVMIVPEEPTRTKTSLPKLPPSKLVETPEVLVVQVVPLSEEVMIVPDSPDVTKVLFPNATALRPVDTPEVLDVHVVLSVLLFIVQYEPTVTKNYSRK